MFSFIYILYFKKKKFIHKLVKIMSYSQFIINYKYNITIHYI